MNPNEYLKLMGIEESKSIWPSSTWSIAPWKVMNFHLKLLKEIGQIQ